MKSNAPAIVFHSLTIAKHRATKYLRYLLKCASAPMISLFIAMGFCPAIIAQQCPEEIYFFDTVGSAGAISISDDTLALGGSLTGFSLLDISTPQDLRLLSNTITFGVDPCPTLAPEFPDLIMSGDLLFVSYICPIFRADYSGFKIYNISDPVNPILIGGYDTTVTNYMGFYNTQIYNHYLYAALGRWGIAAFDISNPGIPSKIWHDTEAGEIRDIEVRFPLMAGINGGH